MDDEREAIELEGHCSSQTCVHVCMFELKENDDHDMDMMITRTGVIFSETDMYNAIIHTEILEFEMTKRNKYQFKLSHSTTRFIVSRPAYDPMLVLS